jgi:prepilin-type N-terminal cleavage/methylation domain-containing protein
MVSRTPKGFTLIEVVVVIVIVMIIAALTLPIWISAKSRSKEVVTENNLRQTWLALEMYRQGNDGGASIGPSSALGLPNIDAFHALVKSSGIKWWHAPEKIGYGPIYYPMDRSDYVIAGLKESYDRRMDMWLEYNRRHESSSVIVGDFWHTETCGKYPLPNCLFKGFGLRLDGSVMRREAVGDIYAPKWWEESE